jgi:hypothetical protein
MNGFWQLTNIKHKTDNAGTKKPVVLNNFLTAILLNLPDKIILSLIIPDKIVNNQNAFLKFFYLLYRLLCISKEKMFKLTKYGILLRPPFCLKLKLFYRIIFLV